MTQQDFGQVDDTASADQHNALHSFVSSLVRSLVHTATLVQVKAVTDNKGQATTPDLVQPSGWVDVLPLVNDVDGQGNPTKHAVLHGLPWFRLQGGISGIICDPQVGDLGVVVFCDRDVSSVKSNQAQGNDPQSNPGSRRRYSMSDGMYFGLTLGQMPNQYIQFRQAPLTPAGITVLDVNGNTIVLNQIPPELVIKDKTGNLIQMSSTPPNVTVSDVNKNVVTMGPTGIVATDVSKNTVALSVAGIAATDLRGNTIVSGPVGIALTDFVNGNSVVLDPSGITAISPVAITLTAPTVTINATTAKVNAPTTHATGVLNVDGVIHGAGVGLSTHTHGGVTAGVAHTAAPDPNT